MSKKDWVGSFVVWLMADGMKGDVPSKSHTRSSMGSAGRLDLFGMKVSDDVSF